MKIFLAGTYSRPDLAFLKTPYMLESFYYIKEWQIDYMQNVAKMFLLDSGAFTFMNNYKGKVDWDEYIEKYAAFINQYNIKYFFELDIDAIVGIKEVERLRNKLEKLTNKQCIPVWHKSRGIEYWKKITKEYQYVAIGGIVVKEIKAQEYKYFIPLLKIARKNNCKVHGLGFTATSQLKKYHFYSIDSTSWLKASRFGRIDYFDGKKMKTYPKPKNSRTTNYKKCDDFIFQEWIKFQKYADKNL